MREDKAGPEKEFSDNLRILHDRVIYKIPVPRTKIRTKHTNHIRDL